MKKTPTTPEKKLGEPKRLLSAKGAYVFFWILTFVVALWLRTNSLSITAELSPLPEPYNPLADPEMKEALDVMSLANSIIDEVVDKLLNKAAEKILREE
jgi:hypothetical protein